MTRERDDLCVRYATQDDVPRMAEIDYLAFRDTSLLYRILHADYLTPAPLTSLPNLEKFSLELKDSNWQFVVVQDAGTIVAFGKWLFSADETTLGNVLDVPDTETAAQVALRHWRQEVRQLRFNHFEQEGLSNYATLALLATDPVFTRRGYAKMIVQWGIDKIDDMNLATWVCASGAGRNLYQGFDFLPIKQVKLCVDDQTESSTLMWRAKKSSS